MKTLIDLYFFIHSSTNGSAPCLRVQKKTIFEHEGIYMLDIISGRSLDYFDNRNEWPKSILESRVLQIIPVVLKQRPFRIP